MGTIAIQVTIVVLESVLKHLEIIIVRRSLKDDTSHLTAEEEDEESLKQTPIQPHNLQSWES